MNNKNKVPDNFFPDEEYYRSSLTELSEDIEDSYLRDVVNNTLNNNDLEVM